MDPIPSGSVLYTCNVVVDDNTNNDFPLTCVKPGGSTPGGAAVENVSCNNGSVDVPETVSGELGAGGMLTTDTEEDGCTNVDVVETTLTSPNAGFASIDERGRKTSAPTGFSFIGLQVTVVAPEASADTPLALDFCIDASQVPEGATVDMFKDGVLIEDCADTSGMANPDPCIAENSVGEDGNTNITVLTSSASLWNFGVSTEVPPTATPTMTATPIPATDTPVVEATDTPVVQPTPTRNPFDEDDGCQIVAPADSGLAWLLFMPMGMLLWLRRRSR